MHGADRESDLKNDYERACGWYGHFNKSEMALFSECTDRYAQKLLDTADIVREAIYRQVRTVPSQRADLLFWRIQSANLAMSCTTSLIELWKDPRHRQSRPELRHRLEAN